MIWFVRHGETVWNVEKPFLKARQHIRIMYLRDPDILF